MTFDSEEAATSFLYRNEIVVINDTIVLEKDSEYAPEEWQAIAYLTEKFGYQWTRNNGVYHEEKKLTDRDRGDGVKLSSPGVLVTERD